MGNQSTGIVGIVVLAVAAIAAFLLRGIFPALATLLLVAAGIVVVLLIVLVVCVVLFAFRKPKQKQPAAGTTANEVNVILSKGRSSLMELRRLSMRIKNQQIRKQSEEICSVAEKILRTLKEQPERIPGVRQFFNYYLPTLGSVLLKYVRMEESGMTTAETTQRVISCLDDIKTAMGKQYTSLFDNDQLDLSVEMEALTLACKRDGLLADENMELRDGDRSITLTL